MGKKATLIAFTLVAISICDTFGGEPGQPGGIFGGGGGGGGGGQPGMPGGIYGGGGGGGFWGIPGRPGGINGGGGGGGGGQPGKPGGILGGGGGGGGGGQPGLPGGYYEYYYPGHYFTSLPTGNNTKERKTWLAALFRKYLAELDEDDDLLVLRKKRHSKIH